MKQAINRAAALGTESVSTDDQLLDLWLHGKSANTRRTYRREAMCFREQREKVRDGEWDGSLRLT
jgi:hypothetical protein